jgi:hypothetical protein
MISYEVAVMSGCVLRANAHEGSQLTVLRWGCLAFAGHAQSFCKVAFDGLMGSVRVARVGFY